jgi:peptidoglycan hydrolase-like protein with peptidoglycan-binding domain
LNGEHDFNIRQIQRALRILHKNGEDIPIVYEDGIFGEETERGIIAFQAQNGLSPNGIVDYDTWVLLMEKANEYIRKNAEPFPIFPYVSDEESSVLPRKKERQFGFSRQC